MSIEKEDVDELVDLIFKEKEVKKEIFEEIQRQELSEYLQNRILYCSHEAIIDYLSDKVLHHNEIQLHS